MPLAADVLIVARQDDRVAIRLRHALERRSIRVMQLDGPSASRIFTIQVQPNATSIVPSVPMFIRATAWWSDTAPQTPDEVFLRAEEYATLWAAAALSKRPVINRPGRRGSAGRVTWGAIANVLAMAPAPEHSEIFASGPDVITDQDQTMWAEGPNYVSGPIAGLASGVPIRARKISLLAVYEIISVVGARAFSATNDPRTEQFDLIGRSLVLAQRLGVYFATVTWAIADGCATPVRLNDTPDEAELRYAWPEVTRALCEDLVQ